MRTTVEGVLKAPRKCWCYHNYCFYLLLICPHKRNRGQNPWLEVHPLASEKPQLQTRRKKNGRSATLGRQFLKIIMKRKKTAFQNLASGIKVLIMSVWGLGPFCRMDQWKDSSPEMENQDTSHKEGQQEERWSNFETQGLEKELKCTRAKLLCRWNQSSEMLPTSRHCLTLREVAETGKPPFPS